MFLKNKNFTALLRRYHFTVAIIAILIVLSIEGWFLYRYFYQSLLATKTLIELKEHANLEELKHQSYERVKQFYDSRTAQSLIDTKALRDPFSGSALPPL